MVISRIESCLMKLKQILSIIEGAEVVMKTHSIRLLNSARLRLWIQRCRATSTDSLQYKNRCLNNETFQIGQNNRPTCILYTYVPLLKRMCLGSALPLPVWLLYCGGSVFQFKKSTLLGAWSGPHIVWYCYGPPFKC